MVLQWLTLATISGELTETLRRKEEGRIYPWYQRTGQFPPRRARLVCPAEQSTAGQTRRPP
jgi:hypothetical protein